MIKTILLVMVAACAVPVITASAEPAIPDWIRDLAGFWAEGNTSDSDFAGAIEYLINEGIINTKGPGAGQITIGFIPVEKAEEISAEAGALKEFLEKEIPGAKIEIVISTNYETIIEGMRFGHIDAAFMDAGPAWITHQRTGAEAVLAEVVEGKVNYQATVWSRADDGTIQSLEDTIGKKVAFTSMTGSSGFVRPVGSLVNAGQIEIAGDDIVALEQALQDSFEEHTFAGGYKAALELLLNENVDVAFGSDIAPQNHLDQKDQARIRAVQTVGPVPSHVFMVSPDVPAQTRDALVDALVRLNYEENNQILADLYGADALLPTSTVMHIGDFGVYIDSLAGLDRLILDKYDKSKSAK